MLATLAQLVNVRSQLAEGLLLYLRKLKDYPETETLPYLGNKRLQDVYLPPDVQKYSENGCKEIVPWEKEFEQLNRAVILGESGEGKTLLLRMTASRLAALSFSELSNQEKEIADIVVPVVLLLDDVARNGLHGAIEQSVGRLFPNEKDSSLAGLVISHIKAVLYSKNCFLLLDALDEVPDRAALKEKLGPLADTQCRILITSRPLSYERAYLPFAPIAEYTLARFSTEKQGQFIRTWFGKGSSPQHNLANLIKNNSDLGKLAYDPLLLTLICFNSENNGLMAGRDFLNELYRQVTYDILQRGGGANLQMADSHWVDELQYLIQAVAWKLFKSNPPETTYDYARFRNVVLEMQEQFKIKLDPETAIGKLERAGLLITLTKGQISFIHTSFRVYLAAAHLNGLSEPEGQIAELFQKGAWKSGAEEIKSFLGSLGIKKTRPYLAIILSFCFFMIMILIAGVVFYKKFYLEFSGFAADFTPAWLTVNQSDAQNNYYLQSSPKIPSSIKWYRFDPGGLQPDQPPQINYQGSTDFLVYNSNLYSKKGWTGFSLKRYIFRYNLFDKSELIFVIDADDDDTLEIGLKDIFAHDPKVALPIKKGWAGYRIPLSSFQDIEKGKVEIFLFAHSKGVGSKDKNSFRVVFIGTG
jgi:hypothetical protein